jgi:hypothetical protein
MHGYRPADTQQHRPAAKQKIVQIDKLVAAPATCLLPCALETDKKLKLKGIGLPV